MAFSSERDLRVCLLRLSMSKSNRAHRQSGTRHTTDISNPFIQSFENPFEQNSLTDHRSSTRQRARTCRYPGTESCDLHTPDRKVVSNYFGRNKKETLAIPAELWDVYCRQHYQRARYRLRERWAPIQMELVLRMVERLRDWGHIDSWNVTLQQAAQQELSQADEHKFVAEKWLVPYLGDGKTFGEVLGFVETVADFHAKNPSSSLRFELIPNFKEGMLEVFSRRYGRQTTKARFKPTGAAKTTGWRPGNVLPAC
jgi:hypothetical protein